MNPRPQIKSDGTHYEQKQKSKLTPKESAFASHVSFGNSPASINDALISGAISTYNFFNLPVPKWTYSQYKIDKREREKASNPAQTNKNACELTQLGKFETAFILFETIDPTSLIPWNRFLHYYYFALCCIDNIKKNESVRENIKQAQELCNEMNLLLRSGKIKKTMEAFDRFQSVYDQVNFWAVYHDDCKLTR